MSQTTDYVLGHSDFEIERLQIQAAVLANITRRLILECNIQTGMRGFGYRLWGRRCIDAAC